MQCYLHYSSRTDLPVGRAMADSLSGRPVLHLCTLASSLSVLPPAASFGPGASPAPGAPCSAPDACTVLLLFSLAPVVSHTDCRADHWAFSMAPEVSVLLGPSSCFHPSPCLVEAQEWRAQDRNQGQGPRAGAGYLHQWRPARRCAAAGRAPA